MRRIQLTRGFFATVDDYDFLRVNQFSWQARKCGRGWVASRSVWDPVKKSYRTQPLSVFILEALAGTLIDHVSGNPFDNRRANLRLCTVMENNRAFRRKSAGKSSRFRGVCWDKSRARWEAKIKTGGRTSHLGRFDQEEDAARAYDAAATQLFGDFACLNFSVKESASLLTGGDCLAQLPRPQLGVLAACSPPAC